MEILIHPSEYTFSFSKRTVALYQERTGKKATTYCPFWNGDGDGDWNEFRTDPVMIAIVKELGKEENPDLVIETIRPGYESFYKIHQDEGAEWIWYNEAAYTLHQLKINVLELLKNDTMSESARIAAALALLS